MLSTRSVNRPSILQHDTTGGRWLRFFLITMPRYVAVGYIRTHARSLLTHSFTCTLTHTHERTHTHTRTHPLTHFHCTTNQVVNSTRSLREATRAGKKEASGSRSLRVVSSSDVVHSFVLSCDVVYSSRRVEQRHVTMLCYYFTNRMGWNENVLISHSSHVFLFDR